jgi:hypothetical protein
MAAGRSFAQRSTTLDNGVAAHYFYDRSPDDPKSARNDPQEAVDLRWLEQDTTSSAWIVARSN